MSHHMTALAMKQKGLSPGAKIALYYLADHHNGETGECFPSAKRLTDLCEVSRATLFRQLRELEEAGLIERVKRRRQDGGQTSNGYRLILSDPEAQNEPPPRINMTRGQDQFATRTLEVNHGNINHGIEPENPSPNGADGMDLFGDVQSPTDPSSLPSKPKKQKQEYSAEAAAERVREVWNAMAKRNGLTTVTKITSARLSQVSARIKDAGGVEPLCHLIDGMESSDFLMGRANANGRKWSVTLDFFIRESAFVKIAEGAYDNAPLGDATTNGRPTGETPEQMAARHRAMREKALADGTIF